MLNRIGRPESLCVQKRSGMRALGVTPLASGNGGSGAMEPSIRQTSSTSVFAKGRSLHAMVLSVSTRTAVTRILFLRATHGPTLLVRTARIIWRHAPCSIAGVRTARQQTPVLGGSMYHHVKKLMYT